MHYISSRRRQLTPPAAPRRRRFHIQDRAVLTEEPVAISLHSGVVPFHGVSFKFSPSCNNWQSQIIPHSVSIVSSVDLNAHVRCSLVKMKRMSGVVPFLGDMEHQSSHQQIVKSMAQVPTLPLPQQHFSGHEEIPSGRTILGITKL